METLIREATTADAASLSPLLVEVNDLHAVALPRVFQSVGPDAGSAALLRDQIAREDGQAFVAERGGELAGYCWVRLHEAPPLPIYIPRHFAEIDTLVVAMSHRRHGVGRALVERAHQWAIEQGVEQVQLVVWEFNREALRFYESLDYTAARRTLWRALRHEP